MQKSRLESFSDGVLAIIITIIVLKLKVPEEISLEGLAQVWPVYLAYFASFVTIFMMWLNHHNIFSSIKGINLHINWANGFFLFAVSHIPYATEFVGESKWDSTLPVALYGVVMLMVSISFIWLRTAAAELESKSGSLCAHCGKMKTGFYMMISYLVAISLSFWIPPISLLIYIAIPLIRIASSDSYRDRSKTNKPHFKNVTQ